MTLDTAVQLSACFVFLVRLGVTCINSIGSTAEFVTFSHYRNKRVERNYRNAYNKSRVECAVLCYADPQCARIAYSEAVRECSMDREYIPWIVEDTNGWVIYPVNHRGCPTVDRTCTYDSDAGGLTIKVCAVKLSKAFAERACARYGRLLELQTERLVEDTISVITSTSMSGKWGYCNRKGYRVAGIYTETSGTWLLPDGSPIWRNNASSPDNDVTTGDCVLVNEIGLASVDCNVKMCYLCEIYNT